LIGALRPQHNKKDKRPMKNATIFIFGLAVAGLAGCAAAPHSGSATSAAKPAAGRVAAQSSAAAVVLPAADKGAAQRLLSADETLQPLYFPATGSTTVSGRIEGYASPAYAVPVAEGQTLIVTMENASDNAYFNVHDAADSSGVAVFRGEVDGRTARISAPRDMTYVIRPFQPRAMARRNETASYTFTIERR
jgi:hypothetical protein